MKTPIRVLVGVDAAPDALRELLTDEAGLRHDGSERIERRLLDSFDWRVWNAGAVLEHEMSAVGGSLVWRRRPTTGDADHQIVARQPSPSVPATIDDLAPGPVRRLLAPSLDVRALLPWAATEVDQQRFVLLDDQDKTVVRATIEQISVEGRDDVEDAELGWQVVVTGVRGYDRQLERFVERLRRAPDLVAGHDEPDRRLFDATGVRPADQAGERDGVVTAGMSTLDAFTTVCRTLLDTIEANEPGVRDDIDTEFLRDVRTCAWRMAVVLDHADDVIAVGPRTRYRTSFLRMLSMTADLRHLDAALLGFDDLAARLPVERRSDLAALRDLLMDLRGEEHARVAAMIRSERHRDLLDGWREFLDAPVAGPAAPSPAGRTAGRTIRRLHRGVVRRCRAIDGDVPAAAAGEIVECLEELQYLLAVHRRLYANRDWERLASEIDGLLSPLRAVRDCDVQITDLRRFAELLDERPGPTAPAGLAMGLLTTQLMQQWSDARERAAERMGRFDRPKNRKRVRRVVGSIKESAS